MHMYTCVLRVWPCCILTHLLWNHLLKYTCAYVRLCTACMAMLYSHPPVVESPLEIHTFICSMSDKHYVIKNILVATVGSIIVFSTLAHDITLLIFCMHLCTSMYVPVLFVLIGPSEVSAKSATISTTSSLCSPNLLTNVCGNQGLKTSHPQ